MDPSARASKHSDPDEEVRQILRVLPPDLWTFRQSVVDLLARIFPSNIVLWQTLQRGSGDLLEIQFSFLGSKQHRTQAHECMEDPDGPRTVRTLFRRNHAENGCPNPIVRAHQVTGDVTPRAASDIMSEAEYLRSSLYRACFDHDHGAADVLFTFISDPTVVNVIAVERESWGFSSRERTLIKEVRDYTQKTYNSVVSLLGITPVLLAGDEAMREMIVLDRTSRPRHVGDRALEILKRIAERPACNPDLYQGSQVAADSDGGLVRLTSNVSARVVHDPDGATILVENADDAPGPAVDHGLSARQLTIMRMIDGGQSSRIIARALHISPRTVDKHVERALRTLGARSRGEGAAMLFGRTRRQPPSN